MATKSFLKNVVITDKKKARGLVVAMEKTMAYETRRIQRIEVEHKGAGAWFNLTEDEKRQLIETINDF